jgi:hypothetical protein
MGRTVLLLALPGRQGILADLSTWPIACGDLSFCSLKPSPAVEVEVVRNTASHIVMQYVVHLFRFINRGVIGFA